MQPSKPYPKTFPALALCAALAFIGGNPMAQAADKAAPPTSSGARQVKVKPADTANLVSHLRRVITDETNDTPPRVLNAFVAKYQQRALDAGIDDLDRQTQYVLLALYTSGKAMEQPQFVALMKNPPASLDAFYDALHALPSTVWEAGTPLWDAQAAK
ncbi:hypothetical protein O3301_02060 [Janthinobacterium sp. SUN211]|uniref:hypothetical protein n=1 Tax=Janthinobacterium sp. SUN211 TaxID=3014786 RepID=UPI0027143693|nr:hypothetical protein [Janthinobacterium sp. SUN211]MDO8047230.1 hypothetical protein [Janthinobacterium sp. SUN211]